MSRLKKYTLVGLGTLCVTLGIIGIFLPILPTTPFLLLAAILYSKSSERFLNWLYTNKLCGSYIKNYREGKGIPLKQKIFTITLLWLTIGSSAIFFIDSLWVRILLGVIAICVTLHLIRVKTYHPEVEDPIVKIQEQEQPLDL